MSCDVRKFDIFLVYHVIKSMTFTLDYVLNVMNLAIRKKNSVSHFTDEHKSEAACV